MEEVCGERVSREREVPSGMEEQELITEAVYDEGSEAWQNDICCEVSARKHAVPFFSNEDLRLINVE